jgi:hypothetical protein
MHIHAGVVPLLFLGIACGDASDAAPSRVIDGGTVGVELVGRYEMAVAADFDISDDGQFAAVSGSFDGTVDLVDLSDPADPARLAQIEVGYNADVQLKGTTLYVAQELGVGSEEVLPGVSIFDVTDPAMPREIGTLDRTDGDPSLESCHNVWPPPDRELLFCASTSTGEIVILSTGEQDGTPAAPVVLASIDPPAGRAHDMFARGDRLYSAWLDGGFTVHDISDPSAPALLGSARYTGAISHNVWPNSAGDILVSTDEIDGGHIRIWDAEDPEAITQIGEFQPAPASIVHDVEVVDDVMYIAHYTAGLVIADLADPRAPRQLAAADFYDEPEGSGPLDSFAGAWGVEARPPLVYVSGMESGLWIYRLPTE